MQTNLTIKNKKQDFYLTELKNSPKVLAMARTSTSITLPEELLDKALAFSYQDSRPLSYLVEKALIEYLENHASESNPVDPETQPS